MNLLALLTFSGILFGILLKKIAKEEIKQGKKYFQIMIKILLVIIAFILMYNFKISWTIIIGILLGYIIPLNYLFFGLSCIILDNFLLYIIIFIIGLPYGSLINKNKKILNELILFLLPMLLFIGNINVVYKTEIASIVAGYLLTKSLTWKKKS